MKFGVCVGTSVEKMKYIKEIGFDYAESHCQDIVRATPETLEEIKATGLEDYIKEKTGLLIDAYFSATKIKWILDNIPAF